jgi:hypothetical protein
MPPKRKRKETKMTRPFCHGTTSVVIVVAELLKAVIVDNCILVIYLVLHLLCLNFLLFVHYGAESK